MTHFETFAMPWIVRPLLACPPASPYQGCCFFPAVLSRYLHPIHTQFLHSFLCPLPPWGVQNWRLCLEMVHLANFSDRQYVCQLWDLALKEVGGRERGTGLPGGRWGEEGAAAGIGALPCEREAYSRGRARSKCRRGGNPVSVCGCFLRGWGHGGEEAHVRLEARVVVQAEERASLGCLFWGSRERPWACMPDPSALRRPTPQGCATWTTCCLMQQLMQQFDPASPGSLAARVCESTACYGRNS